MTLRFAARQIDDDGLTPVHEVADAHAVEVRRAFVRDVRELAASVDVAALERALSNGDVEKAVALTLPGPAFLEDVGVLLEDAFSDAALATEKDLNRALGMRNARLRVAADDALKLSFDETNPRAVQRAGEFGARLVRDVTESMRDGIRKLTADAIASGVAPRDLARRILDEGLGLTGAQVDQVAKFRANLEDKGVSPDAVSKRTGRYHDAVLRRRAETIARTETMAAANVGQREVWEQATAAGLIEGGTKREWIVTPDDRLDPTICEPMDGQQVGLDEPFITGEGESVMDPPVHPRCRCTHALVIE